jgi:GAF domain-containing protein
MKNSKDSPKRSSTRRVERKNRLGGTEDGVAMADGAVAQIDGVAGSDHGVVGVGDGQGNEVVGAMLERGSEHGGNGADQALEIGVGDARLAPHGVVNSVWRLGHGHLRGHLLRRPKLDLCAARHELVF